MAEKINDNEYKLQSGTVISANDAEDLYEILKHEHLKNEVTEEIIMRFNMHTELQDLTIEDIPDELIEEITDAYEGYLSGETNRFEIVQSTVFDYLGSLTQIAKAIETNKNDLDMQKE